MTLFILLPASPALRAAGQRGVGQDALLARRVPPARYQKTENDLLVVFLDVGQGNAVLIVSPEGKTLLYDAGGTPEWMGSSWDPGARVIVPYLDELEINELDYMLMSHSHSDHIGGMPAILNNFKVKTFLDPGFDPDSGLYADLLNLVRARGSDYMVIREGDGHKIDLGKSVKVEIFSPPADFYFRGTNSDSNNNSVLMKVICGDVSFLLTGDLEERGELYAARKYRSQLASNILQVGHHGSATSSSKPFLEQVLPEVALIPVGDRNTFGHPRAEALNRIESVGAEIYRTDYDGHVLVYTDGKTFVVETER
ncbi:MAG: MBL fold metallo-hydrolase [Elusimicrobia bacterium]|nr:MBL fold metallo-hydrolase [Elusimicrobiota bacterium]